jgi:hypothetical protein
MNLRLSHQTIEQTHPPESNAAKHLDFDCYAKFYYSTEDNLDSRKDFGFSTLALGVSNAMKQIDKYHLQIFDAQCLKLEGGRLDPE